MVWHPAFIDSTMTVKPINKTISFKTSLFVQLISQHSGELVISVNMPKADYTDVSKGIATDFGDTCNWVGGFTGHIFLIDKLK